MSFDSRFDARWQHVIAPAIRNVKVGNTSLEPHRVDTRTISDSILTEILDGISTDRLVFADVTSMGKHDEYVIRNGNVMYEVGIAHATRLPEEVLLFRSDSQPLMFDVAAVRVSSYQPEGDPAKAQRAVTHAILNALAEIELRRHAAVQATVKKLGYEGWILLAEASIKLAHPIVRTVRDVLGNISRRPTIVRLLDLGLIASKLPKYSADMTDEILNGPAESLFQYEVTPFGTEVLKACALDLGWNEELLKRLDDNE